MKDLKDKAGRPILAREAARGERAAARLQIPSLQVRSFASSTDPD